MWGSGGGGGGGKLSRVEGLCRSPMMGGGAGGGCEGRAGLCMPVWGRIEPRFC